MPRFVPRVLVVLALAGVVALLVRFVSAPPPDEVRATLSAAGAIAGGDTVGFARATEPRPFVFPDDHGPHPEYRTEWWYLTGNLADPSGRRFGWHITFFRNSLAPESVERASAWSTNQLWMVHFALTDIGDGRHRAFERFAREAVGMAGARVEPFRVWLDDWEIRSLGEATGEGTGGPGGGHGDPAAIFPLQVRAGDEGWEVDLVLEAGKPIVLQGIDGWSQKGPEPGNASYYFSFTRMPTRGRVSIAGESFEVEGTSWKDREWSTSALGEEHVGWDWFSLQLSDGRELMFFELRRDDGMSDPLNHGVVVEADGTTRKLVAGEVELEVTGEWRSPLDGARHPSGWRARIPTEGFDLEIVPLVRDQEMNLSVRYWEGAVDVRGEGPDGPVEGVGFVELTGYGEVGGRAGGGG